MLAEQIQGFGLGVMNARAAWFAKQDPRFAGFLTEGRSFGPHGRGLVIANSVAHYDDALSRELTELVETANLRIRDLGFKPYVAPAVSSGAMQLLLTLAGRLALRLRVPGRRVVRRPQPPIPPTAWRPSLSPCRTRCLPGWQRRRRSCGRSYDRPDAAAKRSPGYFQERN